MVAQFVFLLLARAIFRGTSTEMDVKNGQCYCKKKQIDNTFPWSVLLWTMEMTSKCAKLWSETTPFEF